MKYLSFLVLAIILILCSCNSNNGPDLEINLPISETYVPASVEINPDSIDNEQKRHIIHLVNANVHIVNDISQLPDDTIGFSDAYGMINFKESTLLIKYLLNDYDIETYNIRYYRNTKENSYNWIINIGTSSDFDADSDDRLTRFAILVRKLPTDANVKASLGLTHLGWMHFLG